MWPFTILTLFNSLTFKQINNNNNSTTSVCKMSGANPSSSPGNNSSTSSNTNNSGSNRSQQQQQSASSWNGTFSVSISSPVDLNIQFPTIQLPSGISSLFGELAAHHHQQQHQQVAAASTTAPLALLPTSASSSTAMQNGPLTTKSASSDSNQSANQTAIISPTSSSISDIDQPMQLSISSRANSSPATLSSSTGKSRTIASGSSSCVIPMHSDSADIVESDGAIPAAATEVGGHHQQMFVNFGNENHLLNTTAPPSSQAATATLDHNVGIGSTAPQQRRRRHSNSVLRSSHSADRLSRTARRSSRPRNTTARRHTQGVASFVAAAAAAAGVPSAGNNNNTSGSRNNANRDSTITTDSSSSNSTDHEHGRDEDVNNWRNIRQRLSNLFGMRHIVLRRIIRQAGEFPSLYMVGSLFCAVFVLLVVLMHFFVSQLVATLALLFSASHFNDAFAFRRLVTGGQPSGWLIAAKILFRQFMVGTVLGQTQLALPSLIFQNHQQQHMVATPISTMPVLEDGSGTTLPSSDASLFGHHPYSSPPTFSSTLYLTILAQFFVMDLLLLVKLCVSAFPSSLIGAAFKRRIYQWMEYTCALYRFALPFVPWNAYFDYIWWTVLYGGTKLLFGFALVWAWLLATLRFFRSTHIGSLASEAECGTGEQCTICFSDFRVPIKLKCSHIFCTECIRTWLDREVTCPICRAVVTREDNHFRNGDSMMPCVF